MKINSHGLQDQTLILCQQRWTENTKEGRKKQTIPGLRE